MLTLYHAPNSRSTRIVTLLDELGAECDIRIVTIPRRDGSGGPDPKNPHPEKKVPYLVHDGTGVRESAAIVLYLTDLFPQAGLGPLPGDPRRGAYLSWLFWYAGVAEPVYVLSFAGVQHPMLNATFRGIAEVTARLEEALSRGPWLLGESYSAADLLVHSPFAWFPEGTPDVPAIRDWVARCQGRPAVARTAEFDRKAAPAPA
jgi:glutathione S-transferase